jgi:hypothetical protein
MLYIIELCACVFGLWTDKDTSELIIEIAVVIVLCIPVMLIIWSKQKKKLGTIRCNRCNHAGVAKGQYILG